MFKPIHNEVLGMAPTPSQTKGMEAAVRFKHLGDESVVEFIAFQSTNILPIDEAPFGFLSLNYFYRFEEYLSAFWSTRVGQIRSKYESEIIRLRDQIETLNNQLSAKLLEGNEANGSFYKAGSEFSRSKPPKRKKT